MRELKFRQPIWEDGKIIRWHIWGFRDGIYQHPMNQYESNQYSPFFDTNKVRICEGDIIRTICGIKEVVFSDDIGCFEAITSVGARSLYGYVKDGEVEVVGNIYENNKIL